MKMNLIVFFFILSIGVFSQKATVIADTIGLDSLVVYYYQSGSKFMEVPYLNGLVNGVYKQYHENGQEQISLKKKNNQVIDGLYFEYWENCKVYRFGKYKNGYEHGKWVAFDWHGNMYKTYYFRKGKIKKIKLYD